MLAALPKQPGIFARKDGSVAGLWAAFGGRDTKGHLIEWWGGMTLQGVAEVVRRIVADGAHTLLIPTLGARLTIVGDPTPSQLTQYPVSHSMGGSAHSSLTLLVFKRTHCSYPPTRFHPYTSLSCTYMTLPPTVPPWSQRSLTSKGCLAL